MIDGCIAISVKYVKFFFLRFYLCLEREEGKEKERERNINVRLPVTHPHQTGDLTHNPGMCPNRESNWRPFGSQAGAQSTEPHQPGLGGFCCFLIPV